MEHLHRLVEKVKVKRQDFKVNVLLHIRTCLPSYFNSRNKKLSCRGDAARAP